MVQIFAPFIIGGGYALALTVLTSPKLRFDAALRTLRDVQLLATTAIVSSIVVACAYVALLLISGALPTSEVASTIFQFATAGSDRHNGRHSISAAAAPREPLPADHD